MIYLFSIEDDNFRQVVQTNSLPYQISWDSLGAFLCTFSNVESDISIYSSLGLSKTIYSLKGHTSKILCAKWWPFEGKTFITKIRLATGSEDSTLKIWDMEEGQCVKELHDHKSAVTSIAFSIDGSMMCTGGQDYTINLYKTEDFVLERTFNTTGIVLAISWSPDQNYFSAIYDSFLLIVNVKKVMSN